MEKKHHSASSHNSFSLFDCPIPDLFYPVPLLLASIYIFNQENNNPFSQLIQFIKLSIVTSCPRLLLSPFVYPYSYSELPKVEVSRSYCSSWNSKGEGDWPYKGLWGKLPKSGIGEVIGEERVLPSWLSTSRIQLCCRARVGVVLSLFDFFWTINNNKSINCVLGLPFQATPQQIKKLGVSIWHDFFQL